MMLDFFGAFSTLVMGIYEEGKIRDCSGGFYIIYSKREYIETNRVGMVKLPRTHDSPAQCTASPRKRRHIIKHDV